MKQAGHRNDRGHDIAHEMKYVQWAQIVSHAYK